MVSHPIEELPMSTSKVSILSKGNSAICASNVGFHKYIYLIYIYIYIDSSGDPESLYNMGVLFIEGGVNATQDYKMVYLCSSTYIG